MCLLPLVNRKKTKKLAFFLVIFISTEVVDNSVSYYAKKAQKRGHYWCYSVSLLNWL